MRLNTGNGSAPINAPSERYIIRSLSDFESLLMSWQTQVDLHLHLQLSSDALSKNDLHEITKLLKNKPCYIFLDFCGTTFMEDDILDVATLLSYSSAGTLVYGLDFSQTSVSTSALLGILPVLDLSNLLHLNLSYTLVSDRFFSEILTILDDSNAPFPLMSLSLHNCYRIGESDALCAFIAKATQIQTLDLTGIALNPSALITLADLLYEQEHLEYLSLSNMCNTAVNHYSFAGNWEGDVRQIIYSILQIPRIQSIDLSGTPIKDVGLYYISQVIDKLLTAEYQFSLESINLAHTGMTDKCVSFLKQILQSMKKSSLKSINLVGNLLTVSSMEDLQKVSELVGIRLLFDPPLAYYGKGLFSRLLERDTQFMDKYSFLSLLEHIPFDKLKHINDNLNRIESSYTYNDILTNALGVYSQSYGEIIPYLLDSVPSSAYELPVNFAPTHNSFINRCVPISSKRERGLEQSANLFFSASEVVYPQDCATSNQYLDSITYTFSSDDEAPSDLLVKETIRMTSGYYKNTEVPSPGAKHTSRSINADTGRPLATSALLSTLLHNDKLTVPVSPFFKKEPKTQLEAVLINKGNTEGVDTFNETLKNEDSRLEVIEVEPEGVRCVPVAAPQDHASALVLPFTEGMFVLDESEIVRQKASEQHIPHEVVSCESDSVHSGYDAPTHVDLSSIKRSASNSDDRVIQQSEEHLDEQEKTSSPQHSVASDSWGSTPHEKATAQNSPFSSSVEEVAADSDEWSSPRPMEAKLKSDEALTEDHSIDTLAHTACASCTPISSLSIPDHRKEKLKTYMAQTSDDPRTSKCGFVDNFKIWHLGDRGEGEHKVQALLLALDKNLCAVHDCRQVGDAFGLTATVNMHASALTVTWFDKLKHKTNATMLFEDILIAEIVGSGKSGVIHLATAELELVVSVIDKDERMLFSELLSLFMARKN